MDLPTYFNKYFLAYKYPKAIDDAKIRYAETTNDDR